MSDFPTSFPAPFSAVVVGASGGLGSAFVRALAQSDGIGHVIAGSRRGKGFADPKITAQPLDIADEDSIGALAQAIKGLNQPLRLVIVASGVLHDEAAGLQPEKSWRHLTGEAMLQSYKVNTVGPALIAKHLLPLMPREGKAVFAALAARIGSIGDNQIGGWYAYRAAKAALVQTLHTLSIELQRKHKDALCVGLHPGTVDSGLSEPFQGNVPDDKLFSPDYSVERLLSVVDGLTPADSGAQYDYAGARIPF